LLIFRVKVLVNYSMHVGNEDADRFYLDLVLLLIPNFND
jgi:hypothetical protein